MKKPFIIAIIVLILIIISITVFLYLNSKEISVPLPIENKCVELGCSSDTIYVGSVNSDKYYECNCHYADRIKPENIICFSSDADAESNNYTKSEC